MLLVSLNTFLSLSLSPLLKDVNDDLNSSSEDNPILKPRARKKKRKKVKKKLIFTNQKNQRNGEVYERVLANLKG